MCVCALSRARALVSIGIYVKKIGTKAINIKRYYHPHNGQADFVDVGSETGDEDFNGGRWVREEPVDLVRVTLRDGHQLRAVRLPGQAFRVESFH